MSNGHSVGAHRHAERLSRGGISVAGNDFFCTPDSVPLRDLGRDDVAQSRGCRNCPCSLVRESNGLPGSADRIGDIQENDRHNLPAKRRFCNTVGGRVVEGCAACCCALSAARSRAATTTNLARSSLTLVLRAFFGGAKSSAIVNIFMICPR
jgi:hypothetical protein